VLTVREVQMQDVPQLVELAQQAGYGLTSFPADAQRLTQRVEDSRSGVAPLLVLQDPAAGRIAGTAGLWTRVGCRQKVEPFYAYRLERQVMASRALGVRNEVEALHLFADFDGPTEIGTLFLSPAYRRSGVGRLLSLSRFLLLAHQPERFDRQVIAELRGVVDEHGRSPFWDAVGRHFFHVDYAVADEMCTRDKTFIAELMPRHPIYVPLLPEPVRAVIGQVHRDTLPAKRLLESEGFHFARMVDIFDAGPVLRCDRDAIRTVRDSRSLALSTSGPVPADGEPVLVSRDHPFRVVMCPARVEPHEVVLPAEAIAALGVQRGEAVRVAPARAAGAERRAAAPRGEVAA
jgi:arginine N-succinyltransferase